MTSAAFPRRAAQAAGVAALLAVLAGVALLVRVPDLATLRAWITSAGAVAPVVFVVVLALAVPAPVPKGVLSTAAGLAFGIPLGLALVVAGVTAGAVLSFLLARVLGRDAVSAMARGRLDRVDQAVARHGTAAAIVVRLVPVLPFTVLNYACGVTAMRLRDYVLGTALGVIPGSSVFVTLGSVGGELSPWVPIALSAALAGVTLLSGLAGWLWRRRGAAGPA